VLHLARLLELGVELLPIFSITFVPMRLEQVLAAVREDDRDIPASLRRNRPNEALFAEMPQIARVRLSFPAVMVVQVARGHHAKGSHGRQRARLGLAQGVLTVPVVDALTDVGARQVQLAHEHVARIARLSIASVKIASVVVTLAAVAPARIIEHRNLLERPRVAACSRFWRLISDNRQRLHHLGVVLL
jgi:malonyl CoA-acyl carrier protein transacylase